MMNKIPVIGWIIEIFLTASMSFPFWLIWSVWDVGEKYFYFLPTVYHYIPFWECVGLFIVIGILKSVLMPNLANIKQTNTEATRDKDNKKDEKQTNERNI